MPGFLGNLCDVKCLKGFHGPDCSLTCSSSCTDGECDHVSGACDLSTTTRTPDRESQPYIWIVVPCVVVFVLAAMTVIIVFICKKHRQLTNETNVPETPNTDITGLDTYELI